MMRWLIVVACVGCLLLVACQRPDAEQEIRTAIEAMAEAAESGDLGGFMHHVSDDYTDNQDNDAAALRAQLFILFRQYPTRHLTHRTGEVVLADNTADVMVVAGVSDGPILPTSNSEILEISMDWTREGSTWRVRQASVRQTDAGALLTGPR